jgi:hypothetical protein
MRRCTRSATDVGCEFHVHAGRLSRMRPPAAAASVAAESSASHAPRKGEQPCAPGRDRKQKDPLGEGAVRRGAARRRSGDGGTPHGRPAVSWSCHTQAVRGSAADGRAAETYTNVLVRTSRTIISMSTSKIASGLARVLHCTSLSWLRQPSLTIRC